MKKVTKKLKQSLSILLAVAMVITCVPQTATSAFAAELDTETVVNNTANDGFNTATPDVSDDAGDNAADIPNDTPALADTTSDDGVKANAGEGDVSAYSAEKPEVTVNNNSEGKVKAVYYTTDNAEPTKESNTYGEKVTLETAGTFKMLLDVEEGWTANVTAKVGDAEAATISATEDIYTVSVTDDTTITITAAEDEKEPETKVYMVTLPTAESNASVTITAGATKGNDDAYTTDGTTDITFTVEPSDGYKLAEDGVKYKVGDDADSEGKTPESATGDDGVVTYTISKEEITGNITIVVATVAKISLAPAMVALGDPAVKDEENGTYTAVWTGSPIEPAVTVTYNDVELVKDKDYTVNYSDNTNAGTAKVSVTGIGGYTGTFDISFTIVDTRTELTSENCTVTVDPKADLKYTGLPIEPAVTVSYKSTYEDGEETSKELVKDTDYTVKYANNVKVSTDSDKATVTITGKGDYKGDVSTTFEITKAVALKEITGTIYADTADDVEGSQDLSVFEFKTADEVVTPVSYTIAEGGDNGDVLDGTPSVDGTTLSYKLKNGLTSANVTTDGKIVITAKFDNYDDSTLTVTVKAVEKNTLFFSGADYSVPYTSKPVAYELKKITQIVGGTGDDAQDPVLDKDNHLAEVKDYFVYTYAAKEGSKLTDGKPVDAGEYEVTIKLSNHATYKAEDIKATLTITPIKVTITPVNKNWTVGDNIPSTTATSADYRIVPALFDGDTITQQPTLTYKNADDKPVLTVDDWAGLVAGVQLTIEANGAVVNQCHLLKQISVKNQNSAFSYP